MKLFTKIISMLIVASMLYTVVFSMNVSAAIPNYTSLFTSGVFSDTDEINGSMGYELYVPQDYNPEVSYPLLVFLHGYGERGNNTGSQLTVATLMTHYFTEERMSKYPCIILAPQCPLETTWADINTNGVWNNTDYNFNSTSENIYSKLLVQLMGKIEDEYNVDNTRRYITGISMGGFGTWEVIMHHSDLFAAAAPNCGGTSSSQAENLKNLPIWNFHGAVDPTINLDGSRNMYNAMAKLAETDSSLKVLKYVESSGNKSTEVWDDIKDATYIYTEYSDVDHYCWDHSYEEEYFYDWMFNQRNEDAPELTNNAKCAPNYAYEGTLFDDGSGNYSSITASPLSSADGDLATSWQYASKPSSGSYLGVEWESKKTVDKVYVYWNKSDRATASKSGYIVEYSTDGDNWQEVSNPKYVFSPIRGGAVVDTVNFDAVNAKAVRIVINSTVSSSAPRIHEFGVFNTAEAVVNGSLGTPAGVFEGDINGIVNIDGENIALMGQVVDSDKEMYPGTAAEYLNDGDLTTSWQYNGNSPTYPIFVGIELNSSQPANTVALYWESSTRSTASRSGYIIQYSNNGTDWQEVPNPTYRYGTDADGVTQDIITFNAVTASHYRCYIVGGSNSKYFPKLYEFEIYNAKESNSEIIYNEEKGIATGILPETLASQYPDTSFKDKDGNVCNSTDIIGTGYTTVYEDKEYTVIIKGDVNGDGSVNSGDFMQVRRAFLELFELSENAEMAADTNDDNIINSTDYIRIRAHFLEKINLFS